MQKVDAVIKKVEVNGVAETAREGYRTTSAASHDHIDAINQMFAEFELAYHNQYHKAYAQSGSIALAKKYWLACLSDFSPNIILRATRKVVSSQEYLPSVASIIQACEDAMELYGLPSLHNAYVEACFATVPRSEYKWSHPSVYLAGKATGWFELENKTESQILPLFEYNYAMLCEKVLKGENLEISIPEALPASGSVELSSDDNISRLKELRKNLGL